MKKFLALFLALAMIFALAACGSGAASSKPNDPTSQPAGSASGSAGETAEPTGEPENEPAAPGEVSMPLVEEPYTFTYLMPIPNVMYQPYESYGETPFQKRMAELTNVYFDFIEGSPSEAATQLAVICASGEYPDIFGSQTPANYAGGGIKAMNDDIFMDISGLVAQYAPNYLARIAEYGVMDDVTCEGGAMYGFLQIIDEIDNNGSFGAWIRGDWLEEQGLPAPVTYDDWENTLSTFKSEYNCSIPLDMVGAEVGGTAIYDYISNGYGVNTCMHEWGSQWQNFICRDGSTVEYSYFLDDARDYYTMMNRWYDKGLIDEDWYVARDDSEHMADYSTNQIGIMIFDYCSHDATVALCKENGLDSDKVMIGITDPVKKAGDTIHLGNYGSHVLDEGHYLSTTCSNPELAVRYFDFLYTDEGADIINYGFEGEAYNRGADGSIEYTDLITDTSSNMMFSFTKYAGCKMWNGMEYLNFMLLAQSEQCTEAFELWNSNKDGAWIIPNNMIWDTDDYTDYVAIMADVKTYVSENTIAFINGTKSLDDWDAFKAQIESIGLNDALALVQKTYDANYKK